MARRRGEEAVDISSLLNSLWGSYFLRTSDGALFRSPFRIEYMRSDYKPSPIGRNIKVTTDRKQMVVLSYDIDQEYGLLVYPTDDVAEAAEGEDPRQLFPWIVTDNGNTFEFKMLSEPILNQGYGLGFMLVYDQRIIALEADTKGTWSFDMDLIPHYLDYTETLQGVLRDARWRTLIFDHNNETYALKIDGESAAVYNIRLDGQTLDCSLIAKETLRDFPSPDFYSSRIAKTPDGIVFLTGGNKLTVDLKNRLITRESFPSSFPQDPYVYDENGIAYVMNDNTIVKYDLYSKEEISIPIHWEQVSFGGYVTYSWTYRSGVFSVTGKTRTAQTVTVLIDAQTGNVSLTDLSDYSGSVVKTYYRLN